MLSLILLGFVAGVISGLLGIGGGVVLVPALLFLERLSIHQAMGISLAVIVPTAFAGVARYYAAGNVKLDVALMVAVGGVSGGVLGASFANMLPAHLLKKIFGVFLIVIGCNILFGWSASLSEKIASRADSSSSS